MKPLMIDIYVEKSRRILSLSDDIIEIKPRIISQTTNKSGYLGKVFECENGTINIFGFPALYKGDDGLPALYCIGILDTSIDPLFLVKGEAEGFLDNLYELVLKYNESLGYNNTPARFVVEEGLF